MLKAADADPRYIDEEGNTFHFQTDRFGNVVSFTDGVGATSTFGFDDQSLNYRLEGADPDGAGSQTSPVSKLGYSSAGDLIYVENPDSTTITSVYSSTLHLPTSVTNELGDSESYGYDSVGNLTSYTDLGGNVWTFTYDGHGNRLTETTPDPDSSGTLYSAITTTFTYDSTYYHRLTRTTWDNSDYQDYTYTSSDQIATFTDEAGNVTSYVYDPLDRVTEKTLPDPDGGGSQTSPVYSYTYGSNLLLATETDPLGNTTSYDYNARNWLTNVELPDPDGVGSLSSPEFDYSYDKLGNLTSETRPEFISVSIAYTYDANGRLTTIDGPVSGQQTSYDYDDLGRLISVTDPSGRTIDYEYDSASRLANIIDHDPDGSGPEIGPTTSFTYDDAGQTLSVTDPLGRTTSYAYYDTGLLESVTRPDPDRGGPAIAPVNSYEYDAIGRLTKSFTPSERFTENQYDIFGNVTKFIGVDPDGEFGTMEGAETDYVYNELGWLVSETDTLGNTTTNSYDNLGRVTSVTLPDPDGAGSKTSPVYSYAYDAVGNLTTFTDALGNSTTIGYDNLYRQSTVTQPDPDGAGSLSAPVWAYAYNAQGLLATTTDPLSRTQTRGYDSAGRLTSTTNAGGNSTAYTYDLANRVLTVTTPDPDGTGPLSSSVTTNTYDDYSRLVSVEDAAGELTTYDYDQAGQLLGLTDASGNQTRWAYDELGRMTMETDARGYTRSYIHNVVDRLARFIDRNGKITRYINSGLDIIETWYERTDSPTAVSATTTNGGTGTNEVQTITLSNLETGGSGGLGGPLGGGGGTPADLFRVAFGGEVTKPLDHDASATELKNALEELNSIDSVSVSLTGSVYTITFTGDLAETDVEQLMTDVYLGQDGDDIHTITTEQDALFRVIGIEDSFANYDYTLDGLGRVTNRTEDIVGLNFDVSLAFDFDANSNHLSTATTIGSNLDYLTSFEFDGLNRRISIEQTSQTSGNAVADKRIEFSYNSLGRRTKVDRFEALSGTNPSLRTVFSYDTTNRLSSLDHQDVTSGGTATSLHNYDYSYDAMDRFVSIDSSLDGLSEFTFDELSQLTDADHDSSRADETYNYDETGNRSGTGFSVGDDNLTLSDGTDDYEYDNEGNRTQRTEISSGDYEVFEWDHRNRLIKVTQFDSTDTELSSVEYAYDAYNRMVRRTYDADGPGGSAATDQFFAGFDGKHGTLEFDGTSATDLTHRYLWDGEVLLASEEVTSTSSAGEIQWALTDHVGTIRDIGSWDSTNSEFEIANHRVYNSFGPFKARLGAGLSGLEST